MILKNKFQNERDKKIIKLLSKIISFEKGTSSFKKENKEH